MGRSYHLVDYVGAPDADRVIVMMGSGAEVAHETVEHLNARGEKLGLLKVHLYRPFPVQAFLEALACQRAEDRRPRSHQGIGRDRRTALSRCRERAARRRESGLQPSSDCAGGCGRTLRALLQGIHAGNGQGGLRQSESGSARSPRKDHFTIGIQDDVSHTSLSYNPEFSTEPENVVRAMFYGLGADGTVGANKNSIKIIGENTDNYAQGYFVYDSKKSGAMTISHLRFGPQPIRSSYLISKANFVACHQWIFLERYDMLSAAGSRRHFPAQQSLRQG